MGEISLERLLDELPPRYQTVLKMPLGYHKMNQNYFETIMDILTEVARVNQNLCSYSEWFAERYSASKNVIYNTRKTLERANLLMQTGLGDIRLTVEGEQCVQHESPNLIVARNFIDAYEGFLEFLIILSSAERRSKVELYDKWHQQYEKPSHYHRNYKSSDEQFRNVVSYLCSFGLIRQESSEIVPYPEVILSVLSQLDR